MANDHILDFARFLSDLKYPVWIRHVFVPTVTDDVEDLYSLGNLSDIRKYSKG